MKAGAYSTKYNNMSIRFINFLVLTISLSSFSVQANETTFSLANWVSEGQTKWSHNASHSNFGNPTSELEYQGLESNILELGIRTQLITDYTLQIKIGTGDIDDGVLVDDDYVSALGADDYDTSQSGAHRFSRTHSDVNGDDLFYIKGSITPRDLVFRQAFGLIQLSFGGQYWTENYQAVGVTQVECTALVVSAIQCSPAGTVSNQGVTVISNKVTWMGLSAEMDALVSLTQNLSFKFNILVLPILSLENEDIHHLRTTGSNALRQDPSINMEGNGYGYDIDAGLAYQFSNTISAHLNYRKWVREVEGETITFYGASGGSSSLPLNKFRTTRDGLALGIDISF